MNRRTVLKGGLILAATAHTAAGESDHGTGDHTPISVDAFLAKAMPAEKVRYHTNALMEALNEQIPGTYSSLVQPGQAMVWATAIKHPRHLI